MHSIDEEIFSNVVRTARFYLRSTGTGPGPTSAVALDAAVLKATGQLLEDRGQEERQLYFREASRRIAEGLGVQIADEHVLSTGSRVEWYGEDRRSRRPLWDRYKRYLSQSLSFDDATVASIDRSSDRIVEQLGDPGSAEPFDRRGLVVGQVQSGKTTSYAALINKAIDAGYDTIIVLTGIHESLRVQTQRRIEECVSGHATESGAPGGMARGTPLPIADLPLAAETPTPHLYTTRASGGDFTSTARRYAGLARGPHIFVVKKNGPILRELLTHFRTRLYGRVTDPVTGTELIGSHSLLVVDDEADNASIDSNRPDPSDLDHGPTAINQAIRLLLMQFRRRAYVGYTATPYANILIHKDNETSEAGSDLFPEDFLVLLPAPSNYVGPSQFFGSALEQPEAGATGAVPPLLRHVKDCGVSADPEDWMPRGHKRTHDPGRKGATAIPRSLEDAVMAFVIGTSVRHLRGRSKSHNSMLVHVTRFTKVQEKVTAQVEGFVNKLAVALGGTDPTSELPGRFERLYQDDFVRTSSIVGGGQPGHLPVFPDLLASARKILEGIDCRTINSENEASLDYDQYPNGLNVICIGGDKLSRGLTLEGLTVSYFLRASKMYDTLMQMGRWFGYRPGYKDLCRLYLTPELQRWYVHVTRADEELRGEFVTLEEERRRPSDFGFRVRSHPVLTVTAPAKMAAAEEFRLNFGGRVSQTIHFFRDPVNLGRNAKATSVFLDRIAAYRSREELARRDTRTGQESGAQPLPGYLFTDVPQAEIRAFLGAFQFHPEARTVSAPQLLEFLRRLEAEKIRTSWSVVVASGGASATRERPFHPVAAGLEVLPVLRATKPQSDPAWTDTLRDDIITLGVLASPTDLIGDLRPAEVERLRSIPAGRVTVDVAEREHAARSRACKARDEDHCLLVIYAVQPTAQEADPSTGSERTRLIEFAPGSPLPIGLAIALPANTRMPSVTYVVNSVGVDELEQQLSEPAATEDGT